MDHPTPVSVIIPARNAESTVSYTLNSVMAQQYSGPVEVIVADGSDNSATSDLINRQFPEVQVISNPEKIVPTGLNRALQVASGDVIVRCDAHAVLPPGYIQRVVEKLAETGAANVGGLQSPEGVSLFERAVAVAMTTPLGAGDARYRLGGSEGSADTVYMGAFRRDALDAVGGFDPAYVRNQDYELNWRLRERGEVVWFDPALVVSYRPRASLGSLARQYRDYGRWKSAMLLQHPTSIRVRQLAAPVLILGLVASLVLAAAGLPLLGAVLPLVYLLTLVSGAAVTGIRRRESAAILVPLVLATMHISWGIGFLLPARISRR